jgi:hypothetical protein
MNECPGSGEEIPREVDSHLVDCRWCGRRVALDYDGKIVKHPSKWVSR